MKPRVLLKTIFPEPLRPYVIGGTVIVLFLLNFFIFEMVDEDTSSMNPTIPKGSRMIVRKKFVSPTRYDVVIITYPVNTQKEAVKRVIGLPGERIQLKNGVVFINGEPLEESYLLTIAQRGIETTSEHEVEPNHYYVLGDNRDISLDSRLSTFGTVHGDSITGEVVFIYWPFDHFGIPK